MFRGRSVCPADLDSVFLRKQKFLNSWWRRVLGLASAGGGRAFEESDIPSEPECPCEHWILPTDFYDPPCVPADPCHGGEHYSNPLNSFDDDIATYARARVGSGTDGQQCRIYYTFFRPVLTNKIRLYLRGYSSGDYTYVEVKSEGVWEGAGVFYNVAGEHWYCPTFSVREITEVKVWVDRAVYGTYSDIFEVHVCKLD